MHWNHFLNRIKISGLKVFVTSVVLVIVLVLAIVLRTFAGQGEVDPTTYLAEINHALSAGDQEAMSTILKDEDQWDQELAQGLTQLEEKLQALTLEESRLRLVDHKTDRLRNEMNLSVLVEVPDLGSLGRDWLKDVNTEEELLEAYGSAVAELPQAEPVEVQLLVEDVMGHADSQPKIATVSTLAKEMTSMFRAHLGELRPLIVKFDQVQLERPSEPKKNEIQHIAGPTSPHETEEDPLEETKSSKDDLDTKDFQDEASKAKLDGARKSDDAAQKINEESKQTTTTQPATSSTSTEAMPTSTTTKAAAPQWTKRETVPTTTNVAKQNSNTSPAPEVQPTQSSLPEIGEYYVINSMNEDLVQVARHAYRNYQNPEDYVYLIIEANGLNIENGQIILQYGQTIYIPEPPQ